MHLFIPGGAGYIGSLLVPILIEKGYSVTVYDLFLQGKGVFSPLKDHPRLNLVRGDVRDLDLMEKALNGCETIIHLACSLESPDLESFRSFVKIAKKKVANRFIYISSFALYGKSGINTEEMKTTPLTNYAKFKKECEEILMAEKSEDFSCTALRPGSVYGKAPYMRQRNITNFFADQTETEGSETYPMVHIHDLVSVFLLLIKQPLKNINGEIFNVGYHTLPFSEIQNRIEKIKTERDTFELLENDLSSSKKLSEKLGFLPQFTIDDGIEELMESADDENPLLQLLKMRKPAHKGL